MIGAIKLGWRRRRKEAQEVRKPCQRRPRSRKYSTLGTGAGKKNA